MGGDSPSDEGQRRGQERRKRDIQGLAGTRDNMGCVWSRMSFCAADKLKASNYTPGNGNTAIFRAK